MKEDVNKLARELYMDDINKDITYIDYLIHVLGSPDEYHFDKAKMILRKDKLIKLKHIINENI